MSDDNSTYTSNINSATQAASMLSSPYYLHPSDNPGSLITLVLLTHANFSEWSTELRNSLQAKQKTGFIDGTIPKPEAEPDLSRWLAANSMIVGWIRTSIDSKVRSTVTHVPEAHKLWETLRFRFSVKNGTSLHQLQDEITNCKQDGQSVLEYYGRLTKLWEELQNMKTSRACTCAAAADIEKERADARVHKFLFGLDDLRFASIRSRITDEEHLPDLNIVYSRVIREEHNMASTRSKDELKPWVSRSKPMLQKILLLLQATHRSYVLETLHVLVHIVAGKDMTLLSDFWFMVILNGFMNNNDKTVDQVTEAVGVVVPTIIEDVDVEELMQRRAREHSTPIRSPL